MGATYIASSSIFTRLNATLVYIRCAKISSKSIGTITLKAIELILHVLGDTS